MKELQVTVSSSVTNWTLQNLVTVFSFGVSVRTARVMLICDSRGNCCSWLVNLTVAAVYSLFPYFWCSTVDSIQFHVACCTAVSCTWRYSTDISLVQLLPSRGPNYLPAITHRIYVFCVGGVLFFHHLHNTIYQISETWWTLYFVLLNVLCNPCTHNSPLSCWY